MKGLYIYILASLLCLASAMCAYAASPTAYPVAYKGEKTLGLQAGYISHNNSASAGMLFTYRFSRNFRIAPGVQYVFRHDNRDALIINLDAHFPIPLTPRFEIFPLAGINYSSWSIPHPQSNDTTERHSHLGLNAGVGLKAAVTQRMRLGLIGQYNLVKDFSGCNVSAVIAYSF